MKLYITLFSARFPLLATSLLLHLWSLCRDAREVSKQSNDNVMSEIREYYTRSKAQQEKVSALTMGRMALLEKEQQSAENRQQADLYISDLKFALERTEKRCESLESELTLSETRMGPLQTVADAFTSLSDPTARMAMAMAKEQEIAENLIAMKKKSHDTWSNFVLGRAEKEAKAGKDDTVLAELRVQRFMTMREIFPAEWLLQALEKEQHLSEKSIAHYNECQELQNTLAETCAAGSGWESSVENYRMAAEQIAATVAALESHREAVEALLAELAD